MSRPGDYGSKGGGMARHRKSGRTTKSPKARLRQELDAQRNEVKGPPPLPDKSVKELFDNR